MKLKMYLRGLGIGVVVTTLIFGISYSGKKEMSDAEVIARAKELGMVEGEKESGKLYEEIDAEEIETNESVSEELPTGENEMMSQLESETEVMQQESENETEASQQTEISEEISAEGQEDPNEVKVPDQTVKVTIVSGDDSAAASRRIYEAGLVESAADLDKYLCSNGYSKKVVSGTYEIPVGSDNETIAKIITKNR